LTTFNQAFDRVAMHAVRRELAAAQAEAAGLPLWDVPLPWPCSNEDYERIMSGVCRAAVDAGVQAVAFGDLFLEEVRAYRERQLAPTGLEPLFPLWLKPTDRLARDMVDGGLRATITCLNPALLPRTFAGREYDRALLGEFPPGVDPCGENGEFHTFAWDGPMFAHPVLKTPGEVVERDGFVFADLLPHCT
jgi:diphthamide synthase (EF-2-diphthine--ammonia ligase)